MIAAANADTDLGISPELANERSGLFVFVYVQSNYFLHLTFLSKYFIYKVHRKVLLAACKERVADLYARSKARRSKAKKSAENRFRSSSHGASDRLDNNDDQSSVEETSETYSSSLADEQSDVLLRDPALRRRFKKSLSSGTVAKATRENVNDAENDNNLLSDSEFNDFDSEDDFDIDDVEDVHENISSAASLPLSPTLVRKNQTSSKLTTPSTGSLLTTDLIRVGKEKITWVKDLFKKDFPTREGISSFFIFFFYHILFLINCYFFNKKICDRENNQVENNCLFHSIVCDVVLSNCIIRFVFRRRARNDVHIDMGGRQSSKGVLHFCLFSHLPIANNSSVNTLVDDKTLSKESDASSRCFATALAFQVVVASWAFASHHKQKAFGESWFQQICHASAEDASGGKCGS